MTPAKTQTKFLILLASVLCLYLIGLISLHAARQRQADLLLEDKAREKVALLKQINVITQEPLLTLANDYSLWSEMVNFVNHPDTEWARSNVYVGLSTYKVDAGWVLRADGTLVYDTAASGCPPLHKVEALKASLRNAVHQRPFNHYFVSTDLGIIEIRTAPIQPSDDDSRITPPQGYFCVGRLWDKEYVSVLERTLQCSIALVPAADLAHVASALGETPGGYVRFTDTLPGESGASIATMVCTSEYPLYSVLVGSDQNQMIYIGLFSLALILTLLISFRRWITGPLAVTMNSLQTGHPVEPGRLTAAGIEFTRLAQLISSFFDQKEALEKEVAERQQVEVDLRDRESLLRATLESTADGILVVDNVTGKSHWNTRFRELWRIPGSIARSGDDDQMLAFVLDQLSDPDAFLSRVKILYSSPDESFDTLEFIDGRSFERYSCPLSRDGATVGRVWSFRDVTARKTAEASRLQLQKQLEQAQRMESLGLLAGGVAHDLNNVLGPLVAYPEIILDELPQDTPVRDDLIRMSKSAEHAASVIQDLLALARRGRYEMTPLDLNDIVRSFLESILFRDLTAKHPSVTLSATLADEPLYLLGSAPHLTKVLMKLVVNAFEATQAGSSVTIETSRRLIGKLIRETEGFEAGKYNVLCVRDSGPGIAPEDVAKIFEPYFSKKKMGRSGSGLGLAVVHGIVNDHHGFYDVDSKPGEGAEFVLYFPVSSPAQSVSADDGTVLRGRERVLVVDDDPDQRQLALRVLNSLGYSARVADGAHEALESLKAQPADLVVLDMIMDPGPDGLDTYREILKIRPGQKAIVATGFSSTDRVAEMQRLGAGACVSKPYTRDQLATAIREELSREKSASADIASPAAPALGPSR